MSVIQTLKNNNFKFSKKYGQNFITDTNFLKSLVELSKISKTDEVLEIGAGAGTLTRQIALKCEKLISYEIDTTLETTLTENLSGLDNAKVIFKDALKTPIDEIEQNFKAEYSIVANIPYYITTPLIFKFLEESKRVKSLSLMVQKEVAERIIAKANSPEYSALSVMIDFYGSAKILKIVSKKMFKPIPKVDSAFVQIVIEDKYSVNPSVFSDFVKACFSNRRKTLINNIFMSYSIEKNKLEEIFSSNNISLQARAENLSTQEFVNLCLSLQKLQK